MKEVWGGESVRGEGVRWVSELPCRNSSDSSEPTGHSCRYKFINPYLISKLVNISQKCKGK